MPPHTHCSSRRHAWPLALLLSILGVAIAGSAGRARAADAPAWNLLLGDAVTDTVDVPLAQALEAGRWVLLKDQWVIEPGDSGSARLVTRWKAVHHPLVRFVTGDARVRVAVTMRALSATRTEVSMQGGIATEVNLQGSPVLGLARTAGEHESRGYIDELHARLDDERVARADTAGGAVTPAPASIRR